MGEETTRKMTLVNPWSLGVLVVQIRTRRRARARGFAVSDSGREIFAGVGLVEIGDATCGFLAGR